MSHGSGCSAVGQLCAKREGSGQRWDGRKQLFVVTSFPAQASFTSPQTAAAAAGCLPSICLHLFDCFLEFCDKDKGMDIMTQIVDNCSCLQVKHDCKQPVPVCLPARTRYIPVIWFGPIFFVTYIVNTGWSRSVNHIIHVLFSIPSYH